MLFFKTKRINWVFHQNLGDIFVIIPENCHIHSNFLSRSIVPFLSLLFIPIGILFSTCPTLFLFSELNFCAGLGIWYSTILFAILINLWTLTSSWQGRLLARAGDYSAAADIFQKILELRYASQQILYGITKC